MGSKKDMVRVKAGATKPQGQVQDNGQVIIERGPAIREDGTDSVAV